MGRFLPPESRRSPWPRAKRRAAHDLLPRTRPKGPGHRSSRHAQQTREGRLAATASPFCCAKAKPSGHCNPAMSALTHLGSASRQSAIGPG